MYTAVKVIVCTAFIFTRLMMNKNSLKQMILVLSKMHQKLTKQFLAKKLG